MEGWPKALRATLVSRLLPRLLLPLYRVSARTWRYETRYPERFAAALAQGRPLVGAFLHARTFPLLWYFTRPGRGRWVLMCSASRDGDAMAWIEQRLGFRVVRGSSGRGGVRALVGLIRLLRAEAGLNAGLSIDGSRGPRGIAQPGLLMLAQKTGGLVLPVAATPSGAWIWPHSWDRIVVPRPGARILVGFGEPIAVPADADEATLASLRLRLEEAVLALHAELDRSNGFADTEPLRAPSAAEPTAE